MSDTSARRYSIGKDRSIAVWLGAIIGILTVVALYEQVFGSHADDITDIYDHLIMVKDMTPHGPWNIYSLFFSLVYVLSFGSKDYLVLAVVGTAVITASVIGKGVLSYFVLRRVTQNKLVAASLSLGLIVVMSLPNWWKPEELYIDKIVPTIWFNSTAMLTTPFAILLFVTTEKWLNEGAPTTFLWVSLFSVLSVLTKPNYILAFLPVLGVIVATQVVVRRNPDSFRNLLLLVGLTALIGGILYIQSIEPIPAGPLGDPSSIKESVHIVFAPFAVWRIYSPNIPASLLLSIAFPLGVTLLYFKEVKRDVSVLLAWGILAVAIAQYALLAETGERFEDANWIWASNIAMYLVFLVSTAFLLAQPRSKRFYFLSTLLCLHIATGVYYYVRVALGFGYY